MGVFGRISWPAGGGCGAGFSRWSTIDSGLGASFYRHGGWLITGSGRSSRAAVTVTQDSKLENMHARDQTGLVRTGD